MSRLNTVTAAIALGISVRTLYRRMSRGKLRYIVKGGHRMILLDSLPRGAR
jgi:predicted site-specific integrase-resolvase